jgi:hypothetical protein
VGTSTLSDVEKLAERHKSHFRWMGRQGDRSDYSFEVPNTCLSYLHIEPAAKFDAWVAVSKRAVQSVQVDVMRDTRAFPTAPSASMVDEYVKYPEYYRAGRTHYGFPTPLGKPYLPVGLDIRAAAEQRDQAYAFSLRCLVKPGGGCDLPCDYLPLAGRDWESGLEIRRVVGATHSSSFTHQIPISSPASMPSALQKAAGMTKPPPLAALTRRF